MEFHGGTLGGGTYKIRFRCEQHADGPHRFVTSALLYPGWKVIRRVSIGVYLCRKLARAEQLGRVRGDEAR